MSRVDVRLADRGDDADLREFVRNADMEGLIRMSFPREPSYFDALEVEGRHSEVVIGREVGTGRLAGVGVGSAKPVHLNGDVRTVGYLSGLRVAPEFRNGMLLVRIYRMAEERHEAQDVVLSLTTILEANRPAVKLLTSGKCGLPVYEDLGRYLTLALSLRRPNPFSEAGGVAVVHATRHDAAEIVEFLRREGASRQFFPVYEEGDLLSPTGLLRGLPIENVFLARDGENLVGTAALWDQRPFRQSMVTGYSRLLSTGRLPYNACAFLAGLPLLPPAGSVLDHAFVALTCVKGDAPDVMESLSASLFRMARGAGCSFLSAGFHERDPLLDVFRRKRCFELVSRLYAAHWEGGRELFGELDGRVPYLEVGSL